MATLSSSLDLVKLLRGGYAVSDPHCFCQCGKFCPSANACIPVKGEVHQPYWTLREVRTAKGRAWAGCLYDPQEERLIVHTLYGRVYPTPCAAADLVLAHALNTQTHPIRFDHTQFCTVDLAAIEQRLAQRLYDIGYGMFLLDDTSDRRHPLIEAGYQAAQAEAEAAIVDKEPGFVWVLSTDPLVEMAVPA